MCFDLMFRTRCKAESGYQFLCIAAALRITVASWSWCGVAVFVSIVPTTLPPQ